MKTNIERLIARICEGSDTESELIRKFFIAYKKCLTEPRDTLYREWVCDFLDKYNIYRGQTDVDKIIAQDKALMESISKDGIRVPVRIFQSIGKVGLDGCHRTICCHVLGFKDIPYVDDGVIPYQETDPALAADRERQVKYEKHHWDREKSGDVKKSGERTGPEYQGKFKKDLVDCAAWPSGGIAVDVGSGGLGGMSVECEADEWVLVDPLMDYYKTMWKQKHLAIKGEAENIPLPDNYADTVFCVNALDHGLCRVKGLFEIYRILKPGGYFGFWIHCRKPGELNEGHRQSFSAERIRDELDLVGFIKRGEKVNKGTPDEYIGVFTK